MQTNLAGFLDKSAQLRKRRTAKGLTIAICRKLVGLDSPLKKSYIRSFYCCSDIVKEGDKLTASYCGQRWCYVCNRIRTARLINGYEPALMALPELRFVTLSRPNVTADDLHGEVKKLTVQFRKCSDRLRKSKIKLKGVRKLEITYNEITETFHPHLHVVISGELEAQCLLQTWLSVNPGSDKGAQDNRPADSNSLKEIFKYCTKIGDNEPEVNDIIFMAVKGLRMIQNFGGVKRISEEIEELRAEVYEELPVGDDIFIWSKIVSDWISTEHGYFLIEFYETIKTPGKAPPVSVPMFLN